MSLSKVFFQPIENGKDVELVKAKFKHLIRESKLCADFPRGELVPIKLHMGEKGNVGHVDARVVKVLADQIKALAAKPFVTDTNVLYQGRRVNAVDHLILAAEHGFSLEALGCPVIITDGLLGENAVEIPVGLKHFKKISAAGPVAYLDNLVSVAHVTSHLLTGFAASIKNVAMGLASRAGKLRQHSNIKPHIKDNCVLCGNCIRNCPVQAILTSSGKAFIQEKICVGCGECIVACKFDAVADDYGESAGIMTEKMVEYAIGILQNIKRKIFFNFAIKITRNCDCMAKDEPLIVKDIGIFASADPVACDKAVVDVVRETARADVFQKAYPQADNADHQLQYAAQLGLGNLTYEIVRV